jgi:ketosteroid isomerase-like protein
MSQNIDRLRARLDEFNRTGELVVDLLAPDFEMQPASSVVDLPGVLHGRDALRDSLRELRESFEELTFEAEKFIEAPAGEVVILIHAQGRGRKSGVAVDNHIAWVWTFRQNKAVRMVVFEEPREALEAVGLSE